MAELKEALLKKEMYPENPTKIDFVQTHISEVFIGDKYVYKVKKAVNFGFLDFSTLDKRKYYCEQEVKLNSRFSKDIYLGVVPITFDGNNYAFDSDGEIIEYAVRMKRVPDERLLKNRLKNNQVTESDLTKIASTLFDIHKNAKTNNH